MINVDDIKLSMRISPSNKYLDEDIQRNMDACLLDMKRVGVSVDGADNKLLDKAMELYCKAQYDFQGKMDAYQKNYEKLRDSMSLSEEYKNREKQDEE